MKNKERLIFVIVIIVLIGILVNECTRTKVVIKEKTTIDTVTVKKTDTLFIKEPVIKKQTVVDSFYITIPEYRDTITIPKISKHYYKEGNYDAWISGYRPSLDSIRTYNKTEYRTINKETTKLVENNNTRYYVRGGLYRIREDFMPTMGVSIDLPKSLSVGANLGLYKNDIVYGVNLGFKIK